MSALVPFTAYFRTVPARGKSKWDYIRDLQRLGIQLYGELKLVPQITMPEPEGGQNQLSEKFGSIANGMGVRPQIGNNPSLLMVEGFYTVSSNPSDQPVGPITLIHSNEVLTGPRGARLWDGASGYPTATVVAEVKALHTALDTAASTITDDSGNHPEVFRLVYKNITYGDAGQTFPV
jgi:hypothetical protein